MAKSRAKIEGEGIEGSLLFEQASLRFSAELLPCGVCAADGPQVLTPPLCVVLCGAQASESQASIISGEVTGLKVRSRCSALGLLAASPLSKRMLIFAPAAAPT